MALTPVAFVWQQLPSDVLWYLVGLITADGSLSIDGRHIDITAKDPDFLQFLKRVALLPQRITPKRTGFHQLCYHIQIGSKTFHTFLQGIGLMPNKSKVLGAVQIPPSGFIHFFRGAIDGDGCIRRWIHPTNGREQWSLRISSGSGRFLQWLSSAALAQLGVSGRIHTDRHTDVSVLKYGKLAAMVICRACYIVCQPKIYLPRKYKLAKDCCDSRQTWKRSTTVIPARVAESVDARDLRETGLPYGNIGANTG